MEPQGEAAAEELRLAEMNENPMESPAAQQPDPLADLVMKAADGSSEPVGNINRELLRQVLELYVKKGEAEAVFKKAKEDYDSARDVLLEQFLDVGVRSIDAGTATVYIHPKRIIKLNVDNAETEEEATTRLAKVLEDCGLGLFVSRPTVVDIGSLADHIKEVLATDDGEDDGEDDSDEAEAAREGIDQEEEPEGPSGPIPAEVLAAVKVLELYELRVRRRKAPKKAKGRKSTASAGAVQGAQG